MERALSQRRRLQTAFDCIQQNGLWRLLTTGCLKSLGHCTMMRPLQWSEKSEILFFEQQQECDKQSIISSYIYLYIRGKDKAQDFVSI